MFGLRFEYVIITWSSFRISSQTGDECINFWIEPDKLTVISGKAVERATECLTVRCAADAGSMKERGQRGSKRSVSLNCSLPRTCL